jgi:hypothetical protein
MGRFLVMCTLLADALGLFASYAAGACLFPAMGSILPGWLSWLRDLCAHLYQAPFLWMSLIPHMPSAVPLALLRDPGLTWSIAYLGAHLWYLARHLSRSSRETDLARPQPGSPGGRRWETVQRRYSDYREAMLRFRPAIPLKTPPTFRFFERKGERDARGELGWRGRVLTADRFASYCGQGYLLYRHLREQGDAEKQRSFWSPDPLREERIEHLEALLGTEYAWMERQGIAQLVQPPALPPAQAPRQLGGG